VKGGVEGSKKYKVLYPGESRISTRLCKIGNLKKKNRDHKKVSKQDEDTGNL